MDRSRVQWDWTGFGMELPTLLHLLHLLGPAKRDWLQQKSRERYPRYLLLIPAEAVELEREVAAALIGFSKSHSNQFLGSHSDCSASVPGRSMDQRLSLVG